MDIVPILFLSFVLGLALGSFFNILVWRLYAMEDLTGKNICPSCRRGLWLRDLFPVISRYLLSGKCRFCEKPISAQYSIIEALTGLTFFLVVLRQWNNLGVVEFQPYGLARLLFMLFFASILILVIASDAKYNLIYDIVVLPSVIVAFIWHFAIGGKILDMILGAMVGAIFFGLQYLLSNGRWIGYGDVKLSILIGVLFGWLGTLFVIGIAYILGTAASLIWLLKREKTMKSTLPLGVFLGIAGLYILIYGTRPLERLMHL